jgi:hypothetical protein
MEPKSDNVAEMRGRVAAVLRMGGRRSGDGITNQGDAVPGDLAHVGRLVAFARDDHRTRGKKGRKLFAIV